MSRQAFYILMGILAVILIAVFILGACTLKKSEKEMKHEETIPATTVVATSETTQETVPPTTEETVEETTEETKSAEELAMLVLEMGLNGDDRKAELGDRYDEVQKWIDEHYSPPTGDVLTPEKGVNFYYGVMETYYNLDMSGVVDWMHSLGYQGDYWVRSDGVKMLGDYIMVACDYDWMPKGSIIETSLGLGMVCDTGEGGWYWTDIAVAW